MLRAIHQRLAHVVGMEFLLVLSGASQIQTQCMMQMALIIQDISYAQSTEDISLKDYMDIMLLIWLTMLVHLFMRRLTEWLSSKKLVVGMVVMEITL